MQFENFSPAFRYIFLFRATTPMLHKKDAAAIGAKLLSSPGFSNIPNILKHVWINYRNEGYFEGSLVAHIGVGLEEIAQILHKILSCSFIYKLIQAIL